MPVHDAAAGEAGLEEVHDAGGFRVAGGGEGEEGGFVGQGGVGAVALGALLGAVFEGRGELLEAGGAEVGEGRVGFGGGFEGGEEGVFVV